MEFRFIREGDVFSWQNDSYKLTFSDPHIQPWHDENRKIYTAQDILYYYYDLDTYSRNGDEWEKVSGIRAYDFPAIFRLLDVVEYVLDYEPDSEEADTPDRATEQKCDTDYWFREDYYSVRSYKDVCGERHFEVYAGREDKGITVTVNEWELYELKKCAEAFVQFSIDRSNSFTNDRNNAHRQSFEVKDGKLYEYEVWYSKERNCCIVDKDTVNEVYSAGDFLEDVSILRWEGEHYYSERYSKKTIANITEDKLIFTDDSSVNTGDILYIYRPQEHSTPLV